MPRPSAVNPALPVWDKDVKAALCAERVPFNVTRISSFRSPKFGPTWRLYCARLDTGELGILLFAGNAVRDEAFGGFSDALESTNGSDPIGPCILIERSLDNGRETWEIADAPETARTATKSPKAT